MYHICFHFLSDKNTFLNYWHISIIVCISDSNIGDPRLLFNRFAQSAGPGSKCLRIVLVLLTDWYQSSCPEKYCRTCFLFKNFHHFGRSSITLEPLLDTLLQPWGHFWITLATFLEQEKTLGCKMCHRRRQRAIAYQKLTLLDTILEPISEEF